MKLRITAPLSPTEERQRRKDDRTTVVINLSPEHEAKLQRLAELRCKPIEACVLDLIDAVSPGGSGWRPPGAAA